MWRKSSLHCDTNESSSRSNILHGQKSVKKQGDKPHESSKPACQQILIYSNNMHTFNCKSQYVCALFTKGNFSSAWDFQDTESDTSGTSSRMKGPSLPVRNKVRNFFDTIVRASDALWGIFSAFWRASNCCSMRISKSVSFSRLPLKSVRGTKSARCTSVTRSCGKILYFSYKKCSLYRGRQEDFSKPKRKHFQTHASNVKH